MVIYNGQIVEPKNGYNNVLFVYKNNKVYSGYFDNTNIWKNEGQKTVTIDNWNGTNNGYYLANGADAPSLGVSTWSDGQLGVASPSYASTRVIDNALVMPAYYPDTNRVIPLFQSLIPMYISNTSFERMDISKKEDTLARPPVRLTNSIFNTYYFGCASHNNSGNYTLYNCTMNSLTFGGMLGNKYNDTNAYNFVRLADHCKIGTFASIARIFKNVSYYFDLNYCNLDTLTLYQPAGCQSNITSNTVLNYSYTGNKINVNTLRFDLANSTTEATVLKNVLFNISFGADINIGDVAVTTSSTNYWNRPMFNITCGSGYKLNFINGFPGNLINIFPRAAGYSNMFYPNAGINIAFDTFGKAVSGEKNWVFYQPKPSTIITTNFRYAFTSRNTTSKAYIPNISITGWTHNDGPNVYLTLSGVSCSNLIANMLTGEENPGIARSLNIFNSYIGLTTAGYCIRAYGTDGFSYGNTYKNNGSIINSSILASSVSGTVTEFVMNDYSGHQMWNKNTICMQNVYLTGLNTQVRLNAYTDQNSTQNGFKFNRGNYFVRNLNLYYATWVPGVTTAIRETPANIRFEFRTRWGGYWNSTYTNAMPVWNNMNGILRNVFSNIGPAGANITIDISPQYYTLSALSSGYANQLVLKNIFFGNDASASFGYTNANYGWINITSTMWGQTSGINVRIRRVSACNYANNRFYGNIYINTQ